MENWLQKRHADRIEPLRLVEANRIRERAMNTILVISSSPWDCYVHKDLQSEARVVRAICYC
jgi:hypothetical protein